MQHLKALHPLVAGQHVAHRVVAHVADMDAARRVGEHLQHIAARLGRRVIRPEAQTFVPNALPATVRYGRIETLSHL